MLEKNDALGLVAAVDFKRFADQLDGFADQPAGTILFRNMRVEYAVTDGFLAFDAGKVYHSQYEFRYNGQTFYALPYRTKLRTSLIRWVTPSGV